MAKKSITKDPFSIRICLRHPSRSPESISKALSLKPELSHAVGDRRGKSRAKWKMTFFSAYLQKGNYASEYPDALESVVQFLEKTAAFWPDFMGENGEAELILNNQINGPWEQGDKCFELSLAPAFLSELSDRGIGLRVQGWQGRLSRVPQKI